MSLEPAAWSRDSRPKAGVWQLGVVKRVDVCTFGFLYSDGLVARPGNGPGGVQKAKSAKKDGINPDYQV